MEFLTNYTKKYTQTQKPLMHFPYLMLATGMPKDCMNSTSCAGSRSCNAASTRLLTLERIMRSFNQSGSSKASSEVSTRYAEGGALFSGNQAPRRMLKSLSTEGKKTGKEIVGNYIKL